MTVRLFVSYSHKDDAHRIQLAKHLAPLLREKDVISWFDGDIEPGQAMTPEIRRALRETDIFVALASHHYLASDYCYQKEYRPMLRKSKQGRPRIVVAMVGTCDWQHTEMAAYKALPDDAKSVDKHGNRNQAYYEIVQGIRRVVRTVRQEKGKAQAEVDRLAAQKKAAATKRREAKKAGKTQDGTKLSLASRSADPAKPLRSPSVVRKTRKPAASTGSRASSRATRSRPTKSG